MVSVSKFTKHYLYFILLLLMINFVIIFNVPVLHELLGFIFLALLPGFLIVKIFKLEKLEYFEKFLLYIGLSASFLMIYGVLVDYLLYSFGFKTPLSSLSILISFDIAIILMLMVAYKFRSNLFSPIDLKLTNLEKEALILLFITFLCSIVGMQIFQLWGINLLLILMYLLIIISMIIFCLFNFQLKRIYPFAILLITFSVLLPLLFRFPHLMGHDISMEYYLFQLTLSNLNWAVYTNSVLSSSLSVSLLPTVYQSLIHLNNTEFLFRALFVFICSFSPIGVYYLAKKYIGELYAFLASLFFISQSSFLLVAANIRTNVAIFFFTLFFFVLFNDNIKGYKKNILLIVLIFSGIVSHYSSSYIILLIIFFSWILLILIKMIITKKFNLNWNNLNNNLNLTLNLILLTSVLIFFWYSLVTTFTFNDTMNVILNTFNGLKDFFLQDARMSGYEQLLGQNLPSYISYLNLISKWGSFILIGVGLISMIWVYTKNLKSKGKTKLRSIKNGFEIEYLTLGLSSVLILALIVIVPYISKAYDVYRTFSLLLIILAVFFSVGGLVLGQYLKLKPYMLILLILIPYFLFNVGVINEIYGAPNSVVLSSNAPDFNEEYISDQESYGAKWLKINHGNSIIYSDKYGTYRLISQGLIDPTSITGLGYLKGSKLNGYVYLTYLNIALNKTVNEKVSGEMEYEINVYQRFYYDNKIYDNGGSVIYR